MRITKKFCLAAASFLVAAGAFITLFNATGANVDALTMGSRRDCGYADVIINCGATSQSELLQKYDSNNDGRGNRDIQAIFSHFGIKRTDIAGTTSTVKKGWLNTNGVITVDGKVVADGAKSLYRVHPGKQVSPVGIAGKTFYLGPVANNYSLGADLFVFLNKDGTFKAAIQASCGNPIVATNKVVPPKPKPVYACESLKITKKISRNEFEFQATASAQNATIKSYTFNFGDGNSKVVNTSAKTASTTHKYADRAGTYTVSVTITMSDGKTTSSKNCVVSVTVEKKPEPKPVYACESLKITKKISRTKYEFQATASAQNATIKSYTFNFGDGKSQVVTTSAKTASVTHEYADKAANYTASVIVTMSDGKTTTNDKCKVPVKVEEKPAPKPVYACESLKITKKISRTEYEFQATASATNATIKSYTFNFGDGNSKVVTTSAKTATATHKYADKAGTYTASVIVTMSDGKTTTSEKCKVTVKVEEKPVEDKPSVEIEKTVNGKEHVKVDVGTEFTYEITVRNTGNVVLKNAVVTDKAPSEVTLLSTAEGKIAGNEWTHTIPELKVGESKSFTIKAKYAKYATGTHKNTVCVDTPTVPGGPDDCDDATTETKELIEVCDLTDNTVKTIERSEFDESHMTTDLSKCGEIKVCIIEDKVVKVIAKNEYDETTMTTDLSKCEEAPEVPEVPEVPAELPKTGLEALLGGGLGLGSITAAGYYWTASRRNLLSALLNR